MAITDHSGVYCSAGPNFVCISDMYIIEVGHTTDLQARQTCVRSSSLWRRGRCTDELGSSRPEALPSSWSRPWSTVELKHNTGISCMKQNNNTSKSHLNDMNYLGVSKYIK